MSIRDSYSPSEWQTLQFAPLWVFGAVAGADQDIDEKEMEALAAEIRDAPIFRDPLVREVMLSLAVDLATVMQEYGPDPRQVLQGLKDTADLLDSKTAPAQANSFKAAMLQVGHNVAKASGGGILRRDPVSKEEKAALVLVAAALNVDLTGVGS